MSLETEPKDQESQRVNGKIITELTKGLSITRLADGNYKIDFDTLLESIFSVFAGLSLIVIIVLALSFLGTPLLGPWDVNWLYYLIPVATLVLSIILRIGTDNFFILNKMFQKIIFSRKFLFFQQTKDICSFSDISLVTASGELVQTKSSKYWAFTAVVITRKGKIIKISNPVQESYCDGLEQSAKEIANILRVPYVQKKNGYKLLKPTGPIYGAEDLSYSEEKIEQKKHIKITIIIIASIFSIAILFGVLFMIYFSN